VDWLYELYDELELPTEVLLQGTHQVDRFLSTQHVAKDSLQLVGAVALMLASNHFCKLPHQDGELPQTEHSLSHADDIVYWTDGAYTVEEVFDMESRLLYGFESNRWESPLHFLALACAGSGLRNVTVSIAIELLVACAKHYSLLRLHPRLLAACVLLLAVRNTHASCNYLADSGSQVADGVHWSEEHAARCGYPTRLIKEHVRRNFRALQGEELRCRSFASDSARERSIVVKIYVDDVD